MKILVGPGGIGSPAKKGLERLKEKGFPVAEVEFTHSIYIKSNKKAKDLGDYAKKLGIDLSIHAPYYINLCSDEKKKITASKKRILTSAERGHHMGARYIVFHPGYYGKRTKEKAYEMVRDAMVDMHKVVKKNKWKVMLAPETTGKVSQFGDLDELYRLHKETGCAVCVDFAHMKAKYRGRIDYKKVFDTMKKFKFRPLTAHMSGIEWTDKGEKKHLKTPMKEVKELYKWIRKYKFDIRIINEAVDPWADALKMLRLLQ